jgi:hypothetical protein
VFFYPQLLKVIHILNRVIHTFSTKTNSILDVTILLWYIFSMKDLLEFVKDNRIVRKQDVLYVTMPVTLIREGVYHGNEFMPFGTIKSNYQAWDNIPVILPKHFRMEDLGRWDAQQKAAVYGHIGMLNIDEKKRSLKGLLYIDYQKLKSSPFAHIINEIAEMKPLKGSIGFFQNSSPKAGIYKNKPYNKIVNKITQPDHYAVLLNEAAACMPPLCGVNIYSERPGGNTMADETKQTGAETSPVVTQAALDQFLKDVDCRINTAIEGIAKVIEPKPEPAQLSATAQEEIKDDGLVAVIYRQNLDLSAKVAKLETEVATLKQSAAIQYKAEPADSAESGLETKLNQLTANVNLLKDMLESTSPALNGKTGYSELEPMSEV